MTVAIGLKVGDGVVLGADSAATLMGPSGVQNAYFNAEKVFNLVKGLPIGGVSYGLGGLGGRSITSVIKDLRQQLTAGDSKKKFKSGSYTVEEAAGRVREHVYDGLYKKEYPKRAMNATTGQEEDRYEVIGFMIAGFSANETQAEVWSFEINNQGECGAPTNSCPRQQSGWVSAAGQPEAIQRILGGWSPRILQGMMASGLDETTAKKFLTSQPMEQLVQPAMPIQDAIDLVHFLAKLTADFVRFTPGPPTVAEPIDIAAITRHEGFRWVRRKHYFAVELNPPPR